MELSKLSEMFKALSNEQRLKLFKMIYHWSLVTDGEGGPFCCKGVDKAFTRACDCLNISRSTISHHFKVLQQAGLITCDRHGQAFSCTVNEDAIEAMKHFLD